MHTRMFLMSLFTMLVKSVTNRTAHCSQHTPTEDPLAKEHHGYHVTEPKLLPEQRFILALGVPYLQPSVYLDCLDAFYQSLIHFRPVTIVKPQSKDSEKEK